MNTTMKNQYEIKQLTDISENLFGYLGLTILCFGTIGNIINVVVFAHLESLKTLASSLFLLTSFVCSQLVLVTGLLTRVIRGFTRLDPLYTSLSLCKARWMIRTAANAISLTCVCLAAIDRYFYSTHDVHRRQLITIKRARWMIFLSSCCWLGVFSSYAVFYTAPTPLSCTVANPVFAYIVSYFNLLHYSIIPLSILVACCVLTWRNLGQQPATYLRGGIRLYDQVTRILVAQCVGIFVTSFPNMIWQIYSASMNMTAKDPLRLAQESLINSMCVLIGFSTHAITFYVYLLASATFRKNVKDMFLRPHRIEPTRTVDIVHITITKPDQQDAYSFG